MAALPLAELYEALRGAGFAIGVDDHVRISRLLARDAAWTPDTLRIAIAALVVSHPEERATFNTCWERWLSSAAAPQVPDVVVPPPPPPVHQRKAMRWGLAIGCALAAALAVVLAVPGDETIPAHTGTADPAAAPPTAPPGAPPQAGPPPASSPGSHAALDLAYAGFALGATLLGAAALAAMLGARTRRRFLPGPWRYVLAVPPAGKPVLPRLAIEDAAAELTEQDHAPAGELDIARSTLASARSGGFPVLVFRKSTRASLHAVLQDTAGGANRWQFVYDEFLTGLAREGTALERYTFAASPVLCSGRDGRAVALDDILDHVDGVIAIGDGATALDPLRRERAPWLDMLGELPHRLWINPLPPARWSAGARAIAEHMAMEHGASGAITALRDRSARRARPTNAYPAVIERAPGTASAASALRSALGERAFRLVAAVAVAGPPTIASARWLAEVHALDLDEYDWLAVATLPWFRSEQWPVGLRERLQASLFSEMPRLARTVAISGDRVFAASEPPRHSGAHLVWQLDGALRASQRGDHTTAARELNRIVRTPLAHEARAQLRALRLRDRGRRAFVVALVAGIALVASAGVVATRPEANTVPAVATATQPGPRGGDGPPKSTPDGGESPEPVLALDAGELPEVYVHVGPMSAKTGDVTVQALMVKAATGELARARGVATRWPGGPPTQAALDAQRIRGFYIDGTLIDLTVRKTDTQSTVACKINMLLATFPEKSILGLLSGGASVAATGTAADLALAQEDCITAVIEDLIAKKILPTIANKTGLPDLASAPSTREEPRAPRTSSERPGPNGHRAEVTIASQAGETGPETSVRPAQKVQEQTARATVGRAPLRGRTVAVPTITLSPPPPPQGDLDKAIIRRYVNRSLSRIQYCYKQQSLTRSLPGGTVVAQFFITPNGTVAESTASGIDDEVSSCVAVVIKAIEFPKAVGGGGIQVNYPFEFKPTDREGPIDRPGSPIPDQ